MLKKIMIFASFMTVLSVSADEDTVKYATAVVGTAAAVGTGIYLVRREPNAVKIERFYKIQDAYRSLIERKLLGLNTMSDIVTFATQPLTAKKELYLIYDLVHGAYLDIAKRYTNWFTPWNWGKAMKAAYQQASLLDAKVSFLKDLFTWAPFLKTDVVNMDEKELVKLARSVCLAQSSYPVLCCISKLDASIVYARNHYSSISCAFIYIETLQQIQTALASLQEYAMERRDQDAAILQARNVAAQEQKAKAEMTKAAAQTRQAQALEEQNKIRLQTNMAKN